MSRDSEQCEVVRVSTPRSPRRPAEVTLTHAAFPGWRFDVALAPTGHVTAIAMRWNEDAPTDDRAAPLAAFQPPFGPLVDPAAPDITARLWRTVPVGALVGAARTALRNAQTTARDVAAARDIDLDRWAPWAASFAAEPRPGRRGRDDRAYAAVAAIYVAALGSGHEVEDVAAQLRYSPSQVRNLLHEARRRGLLTRPPRGRAGGQLTDRARELLRQPEQTSADDRPNRSKR